MLYRHFVLAFLKMSRDKNLQDFLEILYHVIQPVPGSSPRRSAILKIVEEKALYSTGPRSRRAEAPPTLDGDGIVISTAHLMSEQGHVYFRYFREISREVPQTKTDV